MEVEPVKLSVKDSLLESQPAQAQKKTYWFGYLPLRSELVPLKGDRGLSGNVDWTKLGANALSSIIIGIRQGLSAIVSATLVFTSSGVPQVQEMFSFGIGMMWYSTMFGSAWYGVFGRLQYNTNATQEVCAILYGAMAKAVASALVDTPERIPATVLAVIMSGTVFTGVLTFLFGKVGFGKVMLSFPTPVTDGFLGCIGWFLVKSALTVTSGSSFTYFYPADFTTFLSPASLQGIACLLAMTGCMRWGPAILKKNFPRSDVVKQLGGLFCQLGPLLVFYLVVWVLQITNGLSWDSISSIGWTYPTQSSGVFTSLWTKYDVREADWSLVMGQLPNMASLLLMTVLCTMTGVIGVVGAFDGGPAGDPDPLAPTDFDQELTVVGLAAVIGGLTNGVVTFHRLGSSVQLRMSGGTHRIAVLLSATFVGIFFFSSAPLGHYIPKFFLGGLFMGSGISFLESAFKSYAKKPPVKIRGISVPSPEYFVTIGCIFVAIFTSPVDGMAVGLIFSIAIFLTETSNSSPVGSISDGESTVSNTMRPFWELEILQKEGKRIILLYLQGALFFGSGQAMSEAVEQAIISYNGKAQFCILSFAKVTSIDASAVKNLATTIKRAKTFKCQILFCRMNQSVYAALKRSDIVQNPDQDLETIMQEPEAEEKLKIDTSDFKAPEQLESSHSAPTPNLWRKQSRTSRSIQADEPHDAFDMETDALDYCGEKIISELYGDPTKLEPYMNAFHDVCTRQSVLSEEAFEKMNKLPDGILATVKPYCEIMSDLKWQTRLTPGRLYLVMQGAVSELLQVEEAEIQLASPVPVQRKAFHGRGGGRRLVKRFPPGFFAGFTDFFLEMQGRKIVCPQISSALVVSRKLGPRTQVWAISRENWEKIPAATRYPLHKAIALQNVERRQLAMLGGE